MKRKIGNEKYFTSIRDGCGCSVSGYSQIYCYLLSKSPTKKYWLLSVEIFLAMLAHPTPNHRTTPRRASLESLVRMMNNRLGCNEITPPLALLSPTCPISCDNVEQNFIYRSNKHFSSSWTDMNMSQLWVMKRRKLNFSHLVFPLLLLASSSSTRGEEKL